MVVMLDGQAEASSSTVSVMLPLFDNSSGVSQSVEPLTSCEIQAKRVRFHEKKAKVGLGKLTQEPSAVLYAIPPLMFP